MSKANIFVLIKTSSEDEDERCLQDLFIKTNVCWVEIAVGNNNKDPKFKVGEYLRISKFKYIFAKDHIDSS